MASVNKVIIVGNLGSDPDVRTFDNGGKIATVSVATSDRWTDRNTGEPRESTEWHRIVFNNRLADVAQQYLRKGSQIYVEGSLHTRKWTDNQGIERYSTEIRASQMQMLGSRNQGGAGRDDAWGGQAYGAQAGYSGAPNNNFNQADAHWQHNQVPQQHYNNQNPPPAARQPQGAPARNQAPAQGAPSNVSANVQGNNFHQGNNFGTPNVSTSSGQAMADEDIPF